VFQWDVCVARHHAFRIVEWVCWLEFDIHIGASCRDFLNLVILTRAFFLTRRLLYFTAFFGEFKGT
jgi:hypothetical protein